MIHVKSSVRESAETLFLVAINDGDFYSANCSIQRRLPDDKQSRLIFYKGVAIAANALHVKSGGEPVTLMLAFAACAYKLDDYYRAHVATMDQS